MHSVSKTSLNARKSSLLLARFLFGWLVVVVVAVVVVVFAACAKAVYVKYMGKHERKDIFSQQTPKQTGESSTED